MEYQRRLVAAAELVLSSDRRAGDDIPIDPTDFGVLAELKPHQVEGASWLVRRYLLGVNVILGDEMGLGKTLQAISFLNYMKTKLLSPGPFLILCPLSVSDGWQLEFAQFCPTLRVLRYVGDKDVRRGLRQKLYEYMQSHPSASYEHFNFDVLLTTYDIALLDQGFLSQIPWNLCVIDEAQRLKNPSSVLYNVLENDYIMPRRLLMTGTPIQNNLTELWSLLHFCMPTLFGTLEQFLSAFPAAVMSNNRKTSDVEREFKILKYILRAFMLRRTKHTLIASGVLFLPPLVEMTIMVPLTPLQKKVYISILRRELPKLLSFSKGSSTHQSLQNIVIQLRKACSHPYLFSGIEPEPFEEGEHLVQASGKLIVLDLLLRRLQMSGHRVLLFSQMTHTLDILQDFLELRNYSYERLDGSVRAEERFAAIRSFSGTPKEGKATTLDNQDAFIFMISTRAGGVGLNLVAADTVIFYEQDWNPQVDKQALQRAHRIGQLNNVLAINLVSEHTIDEVIMQRAKKKLQLSNEVVGGERGGLGEGSEIGDMRTLIFGLQAFDPQTLVDNNKDELDITELNNMSDKVLEMRHLEKSKDDQKFEINVKNFYNESELSEKQYPPSISVDAEVDEAAYQSWVKKFKEASESTEIPDLDDLGRRKNTVFDDQHKKLEREKKLREKRLAKWEALGYRSLAIEQPADLSDIRSEGGSVEFVYGDCTKPLKTSPNEPTIIFSCIDNSGRWGHGGMFTALENLSDDVPIAYQRASEFGDLHLGDLHLIQINSSPDDNTADSSQWVALAVVQSYNPRRKVPRSEISIEDLETCVANASFVATQHSATIHMPRIGYQNGSQRSEWYTVERLLRKYASNYGIKIYVYYFRRQSE